jgi:uncharacterized HAD superfamily protein
MNIGIDIDGVILDTENWFRSMSHIYDMYINGGGVVDPSAVKIQGRMAWTKDDFSCFVEDCMYYGMEHAPLMPCCKYVLEKLRDMGHRLVVITARGINDEKEIELAKDTMAKYGLTFDAVYFNNPNKLPACIQEKIDYMIDDSSDNVRYLSEAGVKCLYFRDFGSLEIKSDKVTEVANWGEIYRFFKDIK